MIATSDGLASAVLDLLRRSGETLGTAESLTGGLVVARLTSVPGASEVVRGSVVSYAVGVKTDVLGVDEGLLEAYGVVSRECAEAMAAGARTLLQADWALATTGVAGPGPSDGQPAGTVHLAVCGPPSGAGEHRGAHRLLHLNGSRQRVREATVDAVLELLLDTLQQGVSGPLGSVGGEVGRVEDRRA
ncbi:MAG: nicotinamide-nucleotide amidohydrolase family protein [Ornithinimicrobium sp.]|uniref:CinA family protein n=1 Tax=Ornithinimicrobium sp. TaxID=1977084 RepID=UPI0026DFF018|nr:nicotinamide-nucleotide amidohydrolase family protein [Ornithinimicrobium sp.]MDO5739389.1 nicotinamide-nucleotide amidohydrolase family protein [Ornithinimicrobium sp.]